MKRSSAITLALMGAYVAGIAWWQRDQQALQRNRYASWDDCSCDYSAAQCSFNEDSQVVGPWYLSDAELRAQDFHDPGPGGRCDKVTTRLGSGSGSYRPPIGTEPGYRSGFGARAYAGRAGG